jgi:hypothetical protein
MKFLRYMVSGFLFCNALWAMQSPPRSPAPIAEKKAVTIVPYLEQLKLALSTIATPEEVRVIIEDIQKVRQELVKYPLERKRASALIARERAFLIGHAKSAADIYNTQVDFLVKNNKPISDDLKKRHANAYINVELIKDFLATLEPQ